MENYPERDVTIYRPGDYSLGDIESARIVGPKVVVIGGGTGLSTLLKGLKSCTENVTAVVTVADDGGGSGVLRDELGMLPPGDIRNCILALANAEPTMNSILNYRFSEGSLKGQSFGNLFLAALNGVYGSFVEAVRRMSDVLAITGRVLPVTTENVTLVAELADGGIVEGESRIKNFKLDRDCRIARVSLCPESPPAVPEVTEAIRNADLLVLGPGSLYTSIIPNLLVDGVVDAVRESRALRVYVCNVMTQEGETEQYSAIEHVEALLQHGCDGIIDVCLLNNTPVPPEILAKYEAEGADQPDIDAEAFRRVGIETVLCDLLSGAGDYARHDPDKLAGRLMLLHAERRPRRGIYGKYDRMIAAWVLNNT